MNYKKIIIAALWALPLTGTAKEITWYPGGHVTYSIQKQYGTVVQKALEMFRSDMLAVTGYRPQERSGGSVAIYQLDLASNKEMKEIEDYRVPIHRFITKKDAFWLGVRQGKIVIVGSDGRGTAYGMLELSRMAGVSPWIYWGDVVPARQYKLTIDDRFETLQSPSVEFRGVFINDEDWSSRVWAHNKLDTQLKAGAMGPRYYHKLFELLLRLRANALWPAMHEGTTAFFKVSGNKEVADSFDIYVGSSHCEPILRNNVGEWDTRQRGPYNFITNHHQVEEYWRERARETAGMDALYTIGMRGIHDGPMEGVHTPEEKLKGMQKVIDAQRRILKQELKKNIHEIPQVFIPYKEVLEIYENGLKIPDDVCLMWCDDNYGYLTRLSDAQQQRRKGGAGVYYHLSYWGRPHDWLWLTTLQPGLLYSEMRRAYDHHARRLWIANVHDPKVAAYDLSLFMDMAWNINGVGPNSLQQHLQQWLVQQFGEKVGSRLVKPMTEFYHLCGIRRPEFMGWSQVELDKKRYDRGWSPVQNTEFSADEFGNELERYLADYERIRREVAEAEKLLRPELKDAFFAAITYPVNCAADMATKQLQSQEARLIGRPSNFHHDEEALESAVRSWNAYTDIQRLTQYYNKEMAGGKWDGNMDMAPRALNVFQAPTLPGQLTADEVRQYSHAAPVASRLDTDGAVVYNACNFTQATPGAQPVEMLGHSMKAVALPRGGSLTYRFYARGGDAVLYTALIPTQPNDKGDLRYQVSIDGGTPFVYSLKEPFRSERWKANVLRGQSLRSEPIHLSTGTHTLVITALDDHIVVDQWMIDYDQDRQFYMLPVKSALQ
jgi:hypothetical protein